MNNKFNVGDIIRSNMRHNSMYTYLVISDTPKYGVYRYKLLCLENNQETELPDYCEINYDIVERAS